MRYEYHLESAMWKRAWKGTANTRLGWAPMVDQAMCTMIPQTGASQAHLGRVHKRVLAGHQHPAGLCALFVQVVHCLRHSDEPFVVPIMVSRVTRKQVQVLKRRALLLGKLQHGLAHVGAALDQVQQVAVAGFLPVLSCLLAQKIPVCVYQREPKASWWIRSGMGGGFHPLCAGGWARLANSAASAHTRGPE